MSNLYDTEREGQIAFFDNFRIPWNENDEVLADNTDGVWNGNLLEFKLNINDLNKTLFQAIKYLSRMRVKGESVPANIILVSLNTQTAYLYKSKDYFDEIHTVYIGAASKDNEGFQAGPYTRKFQYNNDVDAISLKDVLKEKDFMPIKIDENCIVGWAERYYRENPKASKGDFLGDNDKNGQVKIVGEIREPKKFKGMILPYTEKTNEKFKFLMDKLNDHLRKKDLGAFYTPLPYAELAAIRHLKRAISNVPKGNQYIILDRCAGTGALEQAVINTLGEEVASHIICSTYEYYEYKVLVERVGDKVKAIIPATEMNVVYSEGCIMNANAMTKEYIENPVLQKYINDPKCTIILFENPPYRDASSGMENGKAVRTGKAKTFVSEEMKKHMKGTITNDIANQFIWSGFEFYIRQPGDAYVLFAPVKYWKQYTYVHDELKDMFLCNRKHFHAEESAVSCALWYYKKDCEQTESFEADVFDIVNSSVSMIGKKNIKRVFKTASELYIKIKFSNDDKINIFCAKSGEETSHIPTLKGYMTKDVIGYLEADSFSIDAKVRNITRFCLYNGHGCYLTKENYISLLPIWCAKHIPLENWYENGIYATTSDSGEAYTKDADFLKACLIYACLSNQNKCLSMTASDGNLYLNELCFDNTHAPIALQDLSTYTLDDDEKELLKIFSKILDEAKTTKNYKPEYTYGIYQITKELNTFHETGTGKRKKRVYDYPELNGNLDTLRVMLKKYYNTHIREKMFTYELVK